MRSIIIFIIPLIVCSCINEIEVAEPVEECRKLSVGEARAFLKIGLPDYIWHRLT